MNLLKFVELIFFKCVRISTLRNGLWEMALHLKNLSILTIAIQWGKNNSSLSENISRTKTFWKLFNFYLRLVCAEKMVGGWFLRLGFFKHLQKLNNFFVFPPVIIQESKKTFSFSKMVIIDQTRVFTKKVLTFHTVLLF